MKSNKEEKRGGVRAGAGRPKKDPTRTLAFRVRADKADELNAAIKLLISNF